MIGVDALNRWNEVNCMCRNQYDVYSGGPDIWVECIRDSSMALSLNLPPFVQHYLVSILQDYLDQPDRFDTLLGVELLQALLMTAPRAQLIEISSVSLLTAGLFPGRADQMNVSVGYFITLSQRSFNLLSKCSDRAELQNVKHLERYCMPMVDALLNMHLQMGAGEGLTVEAAQALWASHRSQFAHQMLKLHLKH